MQTTSQLPKLGYRLFLVLVVFMPAALTLADIVFEKRVTGDADAARRFSGYVAASSGVQEFFRMVGRRADTAKRASSLPPSPDLPIVKHYPLSPEEQTAITNLLAHARAGKAAAAGSLGDFEFTARSKSETVSVWCYREDIIAFRVFDSRSREFLTPTTSLRCSGITRFIQSILDGERPVDPKTNRN